MRKIGEEWCSLSAEKKKPFQERSRSEFAIQRQALREVGVSVRGPLSDKEMRAQELPEARVEQGEDPSQQLFGKHTLLDTEPVHGSFGCVLQAVDPVGRKCVLKVYKTSDGPEEAKHEIELLQALQSTGYVCRLYGSWPDAKPFPYLCLEHGGSSLGAKLHGNGCKALGPDAVRSVAKQLSAAVRAVHGLKIVHLDIKPGNVLYMASKADRLWTI